MSQIPEHYKPLVLARLHKWDTLSPEKQKQFLEDEAWFQRAAEFSSRPAQAQQQTMSGMTPDQRRTLEISLLRWQQLSPERRQEMADQLEAFFGLRPQERARTLEILSDKERTQIQRTLHSFSQLDPQRRARCVAALDKLVRLSSGERDEFLRNAELWQSLSPGERKSWRQLVLNLSMPPAPNIPPPPRPPSPGSGRSSPSVATN